MILITTAKNDRELIPLFGSNAFPCNIPFGDFNHYGVWTEGKGVWVCGDRKKFTDMENCISDHRHLEQIRAAREAGFDFVYVVFEADWKDTPAGIQYKTNKWKDARIGATQLRAYLLQLQYYAGVPVFQTKNKRETVALVLAIEKMFQKPPEEHSSLLGFHSQPEPVIGLLGRPSLLRRIVKEFPGLGWELSARVEAKAVEKGHDIKELIKWTMSEWEEVPGIGKGLSYQITEALGWHSPELKE